VAVCVLLTVSDRSRLKAGVGAVLELRGENAGGGERRAVDGMDGIDMALGEVMVPAAAAKTVSDGLRAKLESVCPAKIGRFLDAASLASAAGCRHYHMIIDQ
jgi:hypothetical protein